MNVVDSSGWLEFFADGPNAVFFAPAIQRPAELLVPTVSLYQVFKRILQQKEETDALRAVAAMQQGAVLPLDEGLALSAARLSLDAKLPLADSIMLASARTAGAALWTQDQDFEGMEGVHYIKAPKRRPGA
ncbi:MAG TPA: type II toxin-antitoxin system VapC family toxin [Anaerolineales bacterium]|nr:type II toxin-antitoxin system VapC family toxin [Anaerolineales bacterium]HLE04611.1 type II toxin-antitoxin system VapC family toxin [Anaerolineales bacterium]